MSTRPSRRHHGIIGKCSCPNIRVQLLSTFINFTRWSVRLIDPSRWLIRNQRLYQTFKDNSHGCSLAMVLDVVSDSPPTSYDTPASESDPYASSESHQRAYQFNDLPGPLPILGPLFGYTQAHIANAVHGRIVSAMAILQRDLTTDEATALAYWTAKMHAIASWGKPLGAMTG